MLLGQRIDSSLDALGLTSGRFLRRVGLVPVVAFALLFPLMAFFDLGEGNVLNSPLLLLVLNTLFLMVIGLVVSVISARSYLADGSITLLLLGMATASGGIAASVAGFASIVSVNDNIAIFNLGFLLAGGLQLLSATMAVVGTVPGSPSVRKTSLTVGYLAVVGYVVVISILVVSGLAPTFFTSSGPTLTRQWVIGTGISFFATSGVLFGWQYLQKRSQALYWYSLALGLLAIALFGTATYITPNGVFNWIARVVQYIGCLYFLASLLTTRGPDTIADSSFSQKWAEAFRNDRRQLNVLFGTMMDGFALQRILCDANGKPVDYVFSRCESCFRKNRWSREGENRWKKGDGSCTWNREGSC